jgi:hypothetical protein
MEDEMGRACGMYEGEEKCRVVENLSVGGWIILKWVLKNRVGRHGLY